MTRLKGTCYNVKLVDLWFFIKKSKFHISYLYKSYQLIYLILEDHFFNLIYIYIYIYIYTLDWNGAYGGGSWKEGSGSWCRRLAIVGCYWKEIWRLWKTNDAVEQERRLSFIDDWRRYCSCSRLKGGEDVQLRSLWSQLV